MFLALYNHIETAWSQLELRRSLAVFMSAVSHLMTEEIVVLLLGGPGCRVGKTCEFWNVVTVVDAAQDVTDSDKAGAAGMEVSYEVIGIMKEVIGYVLLWNNSSTTEVLRNPVFQVVNVWCCSSCIEVQPPSCLEEPAGATHTIVDVNGESAVISSFDVLRGAVSTHQPLWRLIAELFTASSDIYCNSYCFLNLVISR
ncbi:hypothetical protein GCK32_014110 [Trichostrongylus colubriformis]|uniref:Uncharacterized protein n=1 Tax=Trichostrongylus colubriformis TaxID=6319 RepID=A0AAN8FY41_TRICO